MTKQNDTHNRCENYNYARNSVMIRVFELLQLLFGLLLFSMVDISFAILYLVFYIMVNGFFYFIKCRNCYYFGGECLEGKISKLLFKTAPATKQSIRKITQSKPLVVLDYLKNLLPLIAPLYIVITGDLWNGAVLFAFYIIAWGIISNVTVRSKCICCEQGKQSCSAYRSALKIQKNETVKNNKKSLYLSIGALILIYVWVLVYYVLKSTIGII